MDPNLSIKKLNRKIKAEEAKQAFTRKVHCGSKIRILIASPTPGKKTPSKISKRLFNF